MVRFQGSLLAAGGEIEVYLTRGRQLVFYRLRRHGSDGGYWVFAHLAEAAGARGDDGGPLFPDSLLALVARRLSGA